MSTVAQPVPALVLGPDMTIAQAAAWREVLATALAGATDDLCLDLTAVTEIDSSAVQLLLASAHSLAARGRSLRCAGASAPVQDALRVFGLGRLLDDKRACAA